MARRDNFSKLDLFTKVRIDDALRCASLNPDGLNRCARPTCQCPCELRRSYRHARPSAAVLPLAIPPIKRVNRQMPRLRGSDIAFFFKVNRKLSFSEWLIALQIRRRQAGSKPALLHVNVGSYSGPAAGWVNLSRCRNGTLSTTFRVLRVRFYRNFENFHIILPGGG